MVFIDIKRKKKKLLKDLEDLIKVKKEKTLKKLLEAELKTANWNNPTMNKVIKKFIFQSKFDIVKVNNREKASKQLKENSAVFFTSLPLLY